jgi:D-3-phosphoglycerate dehydrogenase / 2-oxoglutarate reductase
LIENKVATFGMKILIIDEVHPSLLNMLGNEDWSFSYQPDYKRSDVLAAIGLYDGLVVRSKTPIDADLIAQAKRLKFIARAGAGLDLIDIEAVRERNIQLFAANEGNRDAVAEHTVGLLLALMANIAKADRAVRQGLWDREANRGYEVMGKTVGIIGYGFNGRATAQRLSGFGCRILVYDKYLTHYSDQYATEASMSQIFEESDIVSLHIPLNDDTKLMVNDAFIDQFNKPIYFVNVSRGEIVSLAALVKGLENGKIKGAGLDVLENEKLSKLSGSQQIDFDYLSNSNRTILTPHIAGWTFESYVKINEVLFRQIKNYVKKA